MKKKMFFSIFISVMVVLALLLAGCEEVRSIFTPTPTTDTTIEPPSTTDTTIEPPSTTDTTIEPLELSPARDLTGTWVSSLRGHGIEYTTVSKAQAYGWSGDVELILKQEGNTITGSVRIYNLTEKVERPDVLRKEEERSRQLDEVLEALGGDVPEAPEPQTVHIRPEPSSSTINGKVSGTRIEFEDSYRIKWSGGFLTDFMEGTVKRPIGVLHPGDMGIEGTFDLMRESSPTGQILVPTPAPTSTPTPTLSPEEVIPSKPASLIAQDMEYYGLYVWLEDWGFDFNTLYDRASREALINNWTSFWIGSTEDKSHQRIYFDRVGDNWRPRTEFTRVQLAVDCMMVGNNLSELPNPVTVATNDMNAFPDTSICGVDKIREGVGNYYVAGKDKDGYVLWGHDIHADGDDTELCNYIWPQYTKGTYTADADGTVTQVTSGYGACAESAPAPVSTEDLEDTMWMLEYYGEPGNLKTVLEGTEITITFNSATDHFTGKVECNSYIGHYQVSDNILSITEMAVTEEECGQPEGIKQRVHYLKALQIAENYQIQDGKLQINCGDQILVYTAE